MLKDFYLKDQGELRVSPLYAANLLAQPKDFKIIKLVFYKIEICFLFARCNGNLIDLLFGFACLLSNAFNKLILAINDLEIVLRICHQNIINSR